MCCSSSFRWSYQAYFRTSEVTAMRSTVIVAFQPPGYDVDGEGHQGNLPDHADQNVEHVAQEVFVRTERGILLPHLFEDRSPEAPRPHTPVDILQYFLILG